MWKEDGVKTSNVGPDFSVALSVQHAKVKYQVLKGYNNIEPFKKRLKSIPRL